MVLSIALIVTTIVGALAFTAAPPAAAANGCGGGPTASVVPEFWFNADCNTHDNCYAGHWYGDGYYGQKGCDDRFLRDMRATCDRTYPRWYQSAQRWSCKGVAYTYYRAVRAFGFLFF